MDKSKNSSYSEAAHSWVGEEMLQPEGSTGGQQVLPPTVLVTGVWEHDRGSQKAGGDAGAGVSGS